MKNRSRILVLAMLGFSAFASAGMDNTYVTVKVGFSGINSQDQNQTGTKIDLEYDKSFNIGGSVGQKLDMFRTELEFNYLRAKVAEAKFTQKNKTLSDKSNNKEGSMINVMLNGIYDVEIDPNITPYLGIGIGWAHFKSNFNNKINNTAQTTNESTNAFGFQFLAGAQYHMNNVMSIFLEYKFLGATEVTLTKFGNKDYKHVFISPYNINIGFKFIVA